MKSLKLRYLMVSSMLFMIGCSNSVYQVNESTTLQSQQTTSQPNDNSQTDSLSQTGDGIITYACQTVSSEYTNGNMNIYVFDDKSLAFILTADGSEDGREITAQSMIDYFVTIDDPLMQIASDIDEGGNEVRVTHSDYDEAASDFKMALSQLLASDTLSLNTIDELKTYLSDHQGDLNLSCEGL